MEYVQQRNIEKVSRFLDKGLDPNFHDPDTGGKEVCVKKYPIPTLLYLIVFFQPGFVFSLVLSLSLCLHHKMTMYGFSEISLLHAGQSWITLCANLLKFMQIIVQP